MYVKGDRFSMLKTFFPIVKKIFKEHPWRYYLFCVLTLGLILFNFFFFLPTAWSNIQFRKHVPFGFSGFKFVGLHDEFRNIRYVGYYTDKDMSLNQNAAQFAQAQYVLAPVILDLNNVEREFLILDCTSEAKALEKIKEIKALPLKKNQFGIILARKFK